MTQRLPTPEQIEAAKTSNGGWTKKQLAEWGVPWPPPKGWRQALIEKHRNSLRQLGQAVGHGRDLDLADREITELEFQDHGAVLDLVAEEDAGSDLGDGVHRVSPFEGVAG